VESVDVSVDELPELGNMFLQARRDVGDGLVDIFTFFELLWVTICASIVKFLCEVDRLLTVAPVVHQCNR
jgi:hypothetical protein